PHRVAPERAAPGEHPAVFGEDDQAALALRQVESVVRYGEQHVGRCAAADYADPQREHRQPVHDTDQGSPPSRPATAIAAARPPTRGSGVAAACLAAGRLSLECGRTTNPHSKSLTSRSPQGPRIPPSGRLGGPS